ncbi:serine/threonine-protein kinase [Streptomyces sp. NPDC021093]|uniref:serine/threonine-protein kinase n=1 Tax=Streptomyces sp. NPDC021093 TaxID=3365112 RepID=UPI0037BDF0F1
MQPLDAGDPQSIGDYRLLGRLGSGGMGRVYLGRSAGGRTVAVKIVHPHFALDEEFRARFRREVEAARRVGGAWTAPVLDADPGAPVPWVATGYVAGPSLTQAVAGHGPLPDPSVRALGAGLAEALTAVHALGLVHRDVKPSNVLLTLDGPRLIDFGIARAVDSTAALTSTGVSVGSPGYMSPEQILGKDVTSAADVFSLGAVLAYAATGTAPFPGDSAASLLYKVVHEEPELEGLGGDLRALVLECLAKSAADRPTPAEIAARLAPDGAAGLVAAGWLPGPLVAEAGRGAVRLLDLEASAGEAPSGPVPFTHGVVGSGQVSGDRSGLRIPPVPASAPSAGPVRREERGKDDVPGRPGLSVSVATENGPSAGSEGRGRRRSCTLVLTVAGALAAVTLGAGLLFHMWPSGSSKDEPGGAGADRPPAATASTPATASASPSRTASPSAPAATGEVPDGLIGTWTGGLTEATTNQPHGTITLVITKGRKGQDVYKSVYELGGAVKCYGIGRLVSATADGIRVVDRTDPDPARPSTPLLCSGESSDLTLTRNPDGTLQYTSPSAVQGKPYGRLKKQ